MIGWLLQNHFMIAYLSLKGPQAGGFVDCIVNNDANPDTMIEEVIIAAQNILVLAMKCLIDLRSAFGAWRGIQTSKICIQHHPIRVEAKEFIAALILKTIHRDR